MSLPTLKIKDIEFSVVVLTDTEKMRKGLSGKPALGKNKGMLFCFEKEQHITMNMVDMKYPLDMIFIDNNLEVIAVRTLNPGNFETSVDGTRFVLEVNKGEANTFVGEKVLFSDEIYDICDRCGFERVEEEDENEENEENEVEVEVETASEEEDATGTSINIIIRVSTVPEESKAVFKKGGKFTIYEDAVKAVEGAMQVLDDTGKILMNIVGGERIFSIEHTEKIVSLAKKIDRGEASDKELGEYMKEVLHIQDTQAPQYV